MLSDPETTPADRCHIRKAIEELSFQKTMARAERLKSRRVVGATCAATELTVFSESEFTFVVLDECSQMIEVASGLSGRQLRLTDCV